MESNQTDNNDAAQDALLSEAETMLKMGVPISVVAKTLQIPVEKIRHLKNECGNNNE
ncbi:hypothetical protein [Caedibacter taeniospiralis]|uniref:hypothetical protein n=1 Tax=Caedibacter taeniospiralis TaxID=28907 RepID=UPI001302104A|nr:hypothetical protein [Caedibacter taeniospiralis]